MSRQTYTLTTDQNGRPIPDPLAMFRPYRRDLNSDPQYTMSLYIGRWYIWKDNSADGTTHFASGPIVDIQDTWDNRASLDYLTADLFLLTL
jgi:hypothetical protein